MISSNDLSMNQTSLLQMPARTDKGNDCETGSNEPLKKRMLLDSGIPGASLTCKSGNDITNAPMPFAEPNFENGSRVGVDCEFQDPVILERLKGTIKLKLQGSITQAVKGLLSTISLSIEEVSYMKKVTQELQKRIRKLETISRKVEALIIESMPPAPKSTDSVEYDPSGLSTVVIPPHQSQQPIEEIIQAPTVAYVASEDLSAVSNVQSTSSSYHLEYMSQASLVTPNPPVVPSMAHDTASLAVEMPQAIIPIAPLPPNISPSPSATSLSLSVQPPLRLSISMSSEGVCLQWELDPVDYSFDPAAFYELYSYASSDVDPRFPLSSDVWQKVGTIEALPLPMACTLTSVQPENIYYFVVRSIDRFQRTSEWSNVVDAQIS